MAKIKVEELLYNDEPITINRKLAKCLGLKEAVIFQQIHYWLQVNKKKHNNYIEGRYWTFNSIAKWHEEEFDFLSVRTIERTLKSLENEGLLISNMFNKMKGDKTKWYSIDYDKLIEVAEIRLSKKETLSKKRSEAGKKGVLAKKEKASKLAKTTDIANSETINTIQPNWQNGAYNQIGCTIQPIWQNDSAKLVEPIPEISTKTSTKTSTSSNPLVVPTLNLEVYFDKNICKLGTTTLNKFRSLIKNIEIDLVKAIIDYQASINTRSFAGFKKGFDNFINRGIKTVEDLNSYLIEFRQEKLAKKVVGELDELALTELISNKADDVNLENAKDISDSIKEYIKPNISEISYKTFIEELKIFKDKDKVIILGDTEFTLNQIQEKFNIYIKSALTKQNINSNILYRLY